MRKHKVTAIIHRIMQTEMELYYYTQQSIMLYLIGMLVSAMYVCNKRVKVYQKIIYSKR
jgi:hypothetical protein